MRVVALAALLLSACTRCDDTWDGFAQPFLTAKCVRCHGMMDHHERVLKDRELIRAMVASGRMPPIHPRERSGPPPPVVSDAERERLDRWLACGAR